MRVLIADTDEAFVELLLPFFWRHGYGAEIASDGLDCMAILRNLQPDVVVIEAGLLWGGSDGVIALMNEDPTLFDIPVIVVADSRAEAESGSNLRPIRWLQKPFGLGELLRQIQSAVPRIPPAKRCVG
jgi:DNA-binding response OmpR family regulator